MTGLGGPVALGSIGQGTWSPRSGDTARESPMLSFGSESGACLLGA